MTIDRVRDRSTIESVSFIRQTRAKATGKVTDYTNTPKGYMLVDRMVDRVTTGYRKRSRAGEIINSPLTRVTSKYVPYHPTGSVEGPHQRREFLDYNSWVPSAEMVYNRSDVTAAVERLEGLAVTTAYSKVGESDVSTLTELAEIRETLAFLASPIRNGVKFAKRARSWLQGYQRREAKHATRIAAYQRKLQSWSTRHPSRRGKPPIAPNPPVHPPFKVGRFKATDVSSYWLALRYGLMPLVYTVQDVQKALSKKVEQGTGVNRDTARGTASDTITGTWDQFPPAINAAVVDGRFNYRYLMEGRIRVKSRAGVLYVPEVSLQNTWGLYIHQVPAAMYEAFPLSFVADWFWTGAAAYQAVTCELRAKKVLSAWVTTTVEGEMTCTDTIVPANASSSGGGEFVMGSYQVLWKRRRPVSLSDIRVQARINLNLKRVADGLALIHTLVLADVPGQLAKLRKKGK